MATPSAVPILPVRLATAKLPFPAMPHRGAARPWLLITATLALVATVGALTVSQSDWLIPTWAETESSEISEASLRLAIVRERQRIEAYRLQHGRLPTTLEAAGGSLSGVRYTVREDGSYLLEADLGRSYVRLASTGSVQAFLGNSLHVILSRPTG
ncbi:MAG: hypothetical protein SGI84_08165 [Gemmatimonadota bacterium]|nr:hypothetical protein [Gemmatimonadota bacterium]